MLFEVFFGALFCDRWGVRLEELGHGWSWSPPLMLDRHRSPRPALKTYSLLPASARVAQCCCGWTYRKDHLAARLLCYVSWQKAEEFNLPESFAFLGRSQHQVLHAIATQQPWVKAGIFMNSICRTLTAGNFLKPNVIPRYWLQFASNPGPFSDLQ